MWVYLYKQWYGLHACNLSSVYGVSRQNVKCPCAALYYFLHTNSILMTEKRQEDWGIIWIEFVEP